MAAVLSFFIPGLGHLILGKPFSGLFWFVVMAGLYAIALTTIVGFVVAIPAHLICMYRANSISNQQFAKMVSNARDK